MKEALLITGAIFFHAAWSVQSKHDIDIALPACAGIVCIGASMLLWIMP